MLVRTKKGIVLEVIGEGDPNGTPVLCINGIGQQVVDWNEPLIQGFPSYLTFIDNFNGLGLIKRGYYVIRFDNRDVGQSTEFPFYFGILSLLWVRSSNLQSYFN